MVSRRGTIDLWLVAAVVVLAISGLIFLYSTSSWISDRWLDSPHGLVMSQAMKAVLGLLVLAVVSQIDHRRLGGNVAWAVWGGVTMLLLVLAWPSGGELTRNTDRWLRIGPVIVQPAEFARVAVVMLVAWLLSGMDDKRWKLSRPRDLWRPALAAAVPVALVLVQPNFGTALAIGLSALCVAVLAGLPWRWMGVAGGGMAAAATIVCAVYPYPLGRIRVWLDGFADWSALPFQIQQGVIALGSGGPLGVGFGESIQKRQFVPDAHTDLILTIIGEELGFVGLLFLLGLFAIILWRGFLIARRASDRFGYLLAAGLTVQIGLYVVINVGVVTGLLPVTGLPLPFISYGGSALLANLAAVGLIASVSRRQDGRVRRAPRRVMELGV
jgi:cell division protein FtsW